MQFQKLTNKLKELKNYSDPIEFIVEPEKEQSLESVMSGLAYKGNNDTSYRDIPSTYTISNY
ncbi:MAG: hypothetical protein R2728_01375 [Chitinophagales bacterium]